MPSVRLTVLCLSGLQRDLGEGLELLRRSDQRAGFVVYVELHHLTGGAGESTDSPLSPARLTPADGKRRKAHRPGR